MPEKIKVDPIFRNFIPALLPEEMEQLEANLVASGGARDALIVWPHGGNLILVDGHNRHSICTRLDLPYRLERVDFPDRAAVEDWIDRNQLGRRNLSTQQRMLLLGRRYNRAKKAQGAPEGNSNRSGKQLGQIVPVERTSAKLAKTHGVDEKTVRNAGRFQAAAEALGVEKEINAGKIAPPAAAVVAAAKRLPKKPTREAVKAAVESLQVPRKKRTRRPPEEVFKAYPPTECLRAVTFYGEQFIERCSPRIAELEETLVALLSECVDVPVSVLVDAIGHVRPMGS